MEVIECYDIGGTNIRGALVASDRPKIILSKSIRTTRNNPKKLCKQILEISTYLRNFKEKVIAVSLGVPGPVIDGIMQKSPPLQISNPLDFSSELNKEIKEPIYVDNDLNAAARAELYMGIGKKVKNLRLDGIMPAVIYGKKTDSIPISLDDRQINRVIASISSSHLINLEVDGESYTTLIRDRQRHPVTGNILHIDFYEVSMTEKLRTDIFNCRSFSSN